MLSGVTRDIFGASNILFLNVPAGFTTEFTFQTFTELHIYKSYIFLYMLYSNKRNFFQLCNLLQFSPGENEIH